MIHALKGRQKGSKMLQDASVKLNPTATHAIKNQLSLMTDVAEGDINNLNR